ncbi:hypothetical protein CS0771_07410 [Catellatospora sp. IY07-71]|uniref:hypothetical protein n=1 Tax=Catellatospora sp. IY07-71 TaxID=2728827 RepID=UPI001BB30061|nr:hypothetical protein [Catellatospora sp. IY07-71]BCJ71197.1 hypothetical protein CS0771_07410 [Catellatospora sp. IY07-71]
MSGPGVVVEVIVLSEQAGVLYYRDLRTPVSGGAHPDDVARQLAGLSPCTEGGLLHSTSWRAAEGTVVLTYAALPDLRPRDTRPVRLDAASAGAHPLTPSPLTVDLDAVAAHACRHLALLALTDGTVEAAARQLPRLWEPIGKLSPGPAGALGAVAA